MTIFNRTDLAKHFSELGFKVGAEIGVDAGVYSEILCQENPKLKLYSIDIWDLGAGGSRQMRLRRYAEAKARLAPYKTQLIRKYSLEAVNDFTNNSLDFVYIDGGHRFDDVMQDIIGWTKKVKKGGIISGHDYVPSARDVVTAVDAYVKCHGLRLQLTTDPNEPFSWWFTKRWNI